MTDLHKFRVFYNQSIHPELLHLELRRRRLVRLLMFSAIALVAMFAFALWADVLVLSLLMLLALGFWAVHLLGQVKVFLDEFKPRVVGAILDFIDNDINHGTFTYDAKAFIPPDIFFDSKIFTDADEYTGEDYIKGQIREMPIELSELTVLENSPVRSRVDKIFKGVFLFGDLKRPEMRGGILMIPDAARKYLSRTERAFNLFGGKRVRQNLLPEFEAFFDTYATPDARVKTALSKDLQHGILEYRHRTGKNVYVSLILDKVYVAVSQDRDLLEPSIFGSNLSFEVVQEFYEDIQLLLSIATDLDVNN